MYVVSPIRRLYVRCKCHQFGGFMYVASVANSEALYTLQVSSIQRLYKRCKCRQFGGFIYVASVANSDALHTFQLSQTNGF